LGSFDQNKTKKIDMFSDMVSFLHSIFCILSFISNDPVALLEKNFWSDIYQMFIPADEDPTEPWFDLW
jgi:hypothetical protein